MSDRDGYAHGVPCWVDTIRTDPAPAVAFYTELFGWEAEDQMPPDAPGRYLVFKLRGRNVAGAGSPGPGGPPVEAPVWGTHIWVDSADEAAAKVTDAGGGVVMEPFDALDAGRMAILTDPSGATFSVWQANQARGAQLVNEPGAWSMSFLTTADAERAKAFYGAVFGWTTDTFELGGNEIALFRLPGFVGGEP